MFEKLAAFSPGFSVQFTAVCRATFVQCTEIRISTRYYCLQATTYAYAKEKKELFFILNFLLIFIRSTKTLGFIN